jgi:hypothetical protein
MPIVICSPEFNDHSDLQKTRIYREMHCSRYMKYSVLSIALHIIYIDIYTVKSRSSGTHRTG